MVVCLTEVHHAQWEIRTMVANASLCTDIAQNRRLLCWHSLFCLDGSPPAYHLDKGFGAGINNWLVHFEGGGWCNNVATCLARKNTRLGSSKQMANQLAFSRLLSNLQKFNPDFYNWNRIKVMYCDGSSFTGDVEAVNPATNLHFRGARIFAAVIEDLLAKGMKNAANVRVVHIYVAYSLSPSSS
ncbi:hypothetical protein CsSME_00042268 [Camellia sinensis var. sinensis]